MQLGSLDRVWLLPSAAAPAAALQTAVRPREGRTDVGPQSAAGQTYPRVVGAALNQLVEAVARDVDAAQKVGRCAALCPALGGWAGHLRVLVVVAAVAVVVWCDGGVGGLL